MRCGRQALFDHRHGHGSRFDFVLTVYGLYIQRIGARSDLGSVISVAAGKIELVAIEAEQYLQFVIYLSHITSDQDERQPHRMGVIDPVDAAPGRVVERHAGARFSARRR